MKKSFLIVFAAAGLLASTSSCEKEFTCECVQTGKSNHTDLNKITAKKKKGAKKMCKDYEQDTYKGSPFNMGDTRSCVLK